MSGPRTRNLKNRPAPAAPPAPPALPSTFSLRLPGDLRNFAQAYAEKTGVSLNGLICIALSDYLRARGQIIPSEK